MKYVGEQRSYVHRTIINLWRQYRHATGHNAVWQIVCERGRKLAIHSAFLKPRKKDKKPHDKKIVSLGPGFANSIHDQIEIFQLNRCVLSFLQKMGNRRNYIAAKKSFVNLAFSFRCHGWRRILIAGPHRGFPFLVGERESDRFTPTWSFSYFIFWGKSSVAKACIYFFL